MLPRAQKLDSAIFRHDKEQCSMIQYHVKILSTNCILFCRQFSGTSQLLPKIASIFTVLTPIHLLAKSVTEVRRKNWLV